MATFTNALQRGFDRLPLPVLRLFGRSRYRLLSRLRRPGEGWRYANQRMTHDDADTIRYECQLVGGMYPLECFTYIDVLGSATERFGDTPELPELVRRACEHVASKWCGTGDTTGAARDWAMDLMQEYAAQDGIVLRDAWNDDGQVSEEIDADSAI
jgi:hypothetical protein